MPVWKDPPAPDEATSGYRLVRTPTARPIQGHILSETVEGCNTHYVSNRTIPCEAPKCDACEAGNSWRWHGYVALKIEANAEVVLFEITEKASRPLQDYITKYGTLRGARIKATRVNAKLNGRILIHTQPGDLAKLSLPPAPDVRRLMCHIWNIPFQAAETTDHQTRPPFAHTRVDTTETRRFDGSMPTIPIGPKPEERPQQPPAKGNGRPK